MPFWSKPDFDRSLHRLFKESTYTKDAVDRASYNLRLGRDVYLSSSDAPIMLTDERPYITIHPGDYVLLTTYEYLTMPDDLLGFISLRYSFKKLGLLNVSGFHVDPRFDGRLVFSVFNVGTNEIVLRFKDQMFMLFIGALMQPIGSNGVDRHKHDGQESFSLEDVVAIHGRSTSLVQMDNRIRSIEQNIKLYGTIVIGALVVLFALVVSIVK